MRELKINKKPIVRNYSHNLNTLAILDTDLYRGKLIARISNFNIYNGDLSYTRSCKFQSDNMYATSSAQEICFYTDNQYHAQSSTHMFASDVDECIAEMTVSFIQQSNPWAMLRLFAIPVSGVGADREQTLTFNYTHFVGIMCADGITGSGILSEADLTPDDLFHPDGTMKQFDLKLEIGSMIKGFCRIGKSDWKLVFASENTADEAYIVGLAVIPQKNCIDNWLFANYIQLCLHTKGVPLDYFTVRAREYDFALVNPFLPLASFSHYELRQIAGSDNVCEWIKSFIDSGYYIEIMLNERFLPDRQAYGAYDFDHINLIYGYNSNDEYMLLGYAEKPVTSTVSFKEFSLAMNAIKYNSIQRIHFYKFSHNKAEYHFDLSAVIQALDEYTNGTNSANKTTLFICEADKKISWGINALELIEADPVMFKLFLSDVRLSYTIFERNQLMVERMSFLHQRNFLYKDDFKEYSQTFRELTNISGVILRRILYRKNGGIKPIDHSVAALLSKMITMERTVYPELVQTLKATDNKNSKTI